MTPGAAPRDRRVVAAVAALTLLAALLRLPFLGGQSLWFDETFTDHITAASSLGDLWTAIHDTESTPPLFYLLTAGWRQLIGSGSEAALRTVSGVAAVAAVPLVFLAARHLVGRAAALGAAAVIAVSPVLTWYALDARAYALLVALSCVTILAAARVAERPTAGRAVVWGIAVAAALWTHYFAVFLAAGELLWLVLAARRRPGPAAIGCVTAAILTAPLLTLVLDQRDTRSAFIGERSLGGRIGESARQLAMGPNVPNAVLEAAGILLLAIGVVAGAAIALRHEADRPWVAGLVAIPLGLPLLLAVSGIDDHLFVRNLLIGLPGLAILAGLGLTNLRAIPLAAYGIAAVATVLVIAGNWRYQKTDWEQAAKLVPKDEPIVAVPALVAPVAAHYLAAYMGSDPMHARGGAPPPGSVPEGAAVTVVLEPVRTSSRALEPVAGPPPALPGFVPGRERTVEGFRVIEYTAPAPTPVDAAAIGGALVGPS